MKHVIIGSGAAGIEAARELRRLEPNGEIHVFSHDSGGYARCMLHQYVCGGRSKEALSFLEKDFWKRNRVIHHPYCPVLSVNPEKKRIAANEQEMGYDRLLIASGSVSAIPPIPGFQGAPNVFGFRNLADADRLITIGNQGARIVILGSGLIGMDVAYALTKTKARVAVTDFSSRIMARQQNEVTAQMFQTLFEQAGVTFYLGKSTAFAEVDAQGRAAKLCFTDGSCVECDYVVAAAGVRANIRFLEGSGISCKRGVAVNEYLETSVPDVYAAGEVTARVGIWPSSVVQGRIAARNMAGFREICTDFGEMKNSVKFFGVPMVSLGIVPEDGSCQVFSWYEGKSYRRIAVRNHLVIGAHLLGDIKHCGIWRYIINHQIPVEENTEALMRLAAQQWYGFDSESTNRRRIQLLQNKF